MGLGDLVVGFDCFGVACDWLVGYDWLFLCGLCCGLVARWVCLLEFVVCWFELCC